MIPAEIAPGDVAELCERIRELVEGTGTRAVWCDVRAITAPDLCTVELLARLQLTARRLGAGIRLRATPPELLDLLELVALRRVCGAEAILRVESRR